MVSQNAVYEFESPGDDDSDLDGALFEVVAVDDEDFDRDNHTVEVEPVGDAGEWSSHFRDVFHTLYSKVADSTDDL